MKIVYCTDSICYPGGIQTVTIVKANALAKIQGNEVFIIVTDNKREPLKKLENVTLIDLDVNYFEDDYKGWWYVVKGILVKRRLHKQRLQKVLYGIQPDIVISTGTSEKNFLPSMRTTIPSVYIREIHSNKNYRLRSASSIFTSSMANLGNLYDYGWKIKKYDKIIVLTEEDKECNWNGWRNVEVIPNPVTGTYSKQSNNESQVVIAAGRLTLPKNFSSLIRIWKRVAEKYPDWRLEIWGTGHLEKDLEIQIENLGLHGKVQLKGYTNDILSKMAEASVFCLSSKFEGFALVLVEAMSVSLPVISYMCPCGPRDIVNDGKDGFLIPLDDEEMFAERICTLIEDKELRKKMGKEAINTAEHYKVDVVVEKWMDLFKRLKQC